MFPHVIVFYSMKLKAFCITQNEIPKMEKMVVSNKKLSHIFAEYAYRFHMGYNIKTQGGIIHDTMVLFLRVSSNLKLSCIDVADHSSRDLIHALQILSLTASMMKLDNNKTIGCNITSRHL